MHIETRFGRLLAMGRCLVALSLYIAMPSASAMAQTGLDQRPKTDRFFVEFRSRPGSTFFGHLYIVYGRFNDLGLVMIGPHWVVQAEC